MPINPHVEHRLGLGEFERCIVPIDKHARFVRIPCDAPFERGWCNRPGFRPIRATLTALAHGGKPLQRDIGFVPLEHGVELTFVPLQ